MIPYLLLADIQNTALLAALVFSERILYPTYLTIPRVWGISAFDDQAAAGVMLHTRRMLPNPASNISLPSLTIS
jgi:hypothetical protein